MWSSSSFTKRGPKSLWVRRQYGLAGSLGPAVTSAGWWWTPIGLIQWFTSCKWWLFVLSSINYEHDSQWLYWTQISWTAMLALLYSPNLYTWFEAWYSALSIYRGIFSLYNSQKTPHITRVLTVCSRCFVQVQIKENIKALRHWPLWRESTDDWWFPSQRASFHLTMS